MTRSGIELLASGDRIGEIAATGVERLVVVPGSLDADSDDLRQSNERFASDVLPRLLT